MSYCSETWRPDGFQVMGSIGGKSFIMATEGVGMWVLLAGQGQSGEKLSTVSGLNVSQSVILSGVMRVWSVGWFLFAGPGTETQLKSSLTETLWSIDLRLCSKNILMLTRISLSGWLNH